MHPGGPRMICHDREAWLRRTTCDAAPETQPRRNLSHGPAVTASVGAQDLAEAVEVRAVEASELHLRDRPEVGRAGIDLDARDRERDGEVRQARHLLHDVL